MNKPYQLGSLAGLKISGKRTIFPYSSALWITLGFFAYFFLDFEIGLAITGGFIAVVLHWLGEICHQLGHAYAAKRAGFPMTGILLWGLLSTSLYPNNEPELPARVHIFRALGGFPASLLVAAAAATFIFLGKPENTLAFYLGWFVFLENALVFGFGALLPMGFTDGSTVLKYWSRR